MPDELLDTTIPPQFDDVDDMDEPGTTMDPEPEMTTLPPSILEMQDKKNMVNTPPPTLLPLSTSGWKDVGTGPTHNHNLNQEVNVDSSLLLGTITVRPNQVLKIASDCT